MSFIYRLNVCNAYFIVAFVLLHFFVVVFLMEFCDLKYEIIAVQWKELLLGFLMGVMIYQFDGQNFLIVDEICQTNVTLRELKVQCNFLLFYYKVC